ncbi:hypothetical protein SARC_03321 [Sphaeroforma arctica JP610]|uniref:Uncharacterized protein n=1 Tax=Sphaeroforma arctica JP610 TaxID=667725 RepID=A0A0L0G607_9EUKA|nr:hypothetical protein SARC_03321 [Sphaeroforma arctica JP610]KNC84457.1 hypothetical protein SARC_03321 [Sphaeroforma arctica JP610]|eukprot:XP_014158359.1 hypothetical protein SARC_03321 [Sphaeroforma arctica JP610]
MSGLNSMLTLQRWMADFSNVPDEERSAFWIQTALYSTLVPIIGAFVIYACFLVGFRVMAFLDDYLVPDSTKRVNKSDIVHTSLNEKKPKASNAGSDSPKNSAEAKKKKQ